jgi:hypothetical protein
MSKRNKIHELYSASPKVGGVWCGGCGGVWWVGCGGADIFKEGYRLVFCCSSSLWWPHTWSSTLNHEESSMSTHHPTTRCIPRWQVLILVGEQGHPLSFMEFYNYCFMQQSTVFQSITLMVNTTTVYVKIIKKCPSWSSGMKCSKAKIWSYSTLQKNNRARLALTCDQALFYK